MTDKQIYQIGLTMINGVGDILARHLLEALGGCGGRVYGKAPVAREDTGYRRFDYHRD